ncbi:D-alanyl-D-alanine carboxypeptidase/D-alanyl-D-alanine-endopeptidase [Peribacillus acanthi]|uniref:D-alanyl-D-alanine carboxypeptidase/D-alanyl-D-alanine endopeptidase n=1 Tax=Peribacillus acanthi TaxID=2171554 RepID=UPI000D3E0BAD|nr:D-alanyl-D-alanine carboxypeptidase/D-alanyl-D-alanine-endopeptidase [Peribacillus acanthi]
MEKKFLWIFTVLVMMVVTVKPMTIGQQEIQVDAEPVVLNSLDEKIEEVLKNPILDGALTSVSIRSAKTGELVYEKMGDVNVRPASNMKILTAAVALKVLGEDYRFSTEIWTDGVIVENVLQGNLYVKGKGNPTLLKEDLSELVIQLKKRGVTVIKGNIIGDDTWYDSERYSKDLSWSDEGEYYGAAVSALTISPNKDYDAGTVMIDLQPSSKIGNPARVKISPFTSLVSITNETKTVKKGEKKEINIKRRHDSNSIKIEGALPVNLSSRSWIAVTDPSQLVMDQFKQALLEQGILFLGKTHFDTTPSKATLVLKHQSMPLKEMIVPMMKLSNNSIAEVLVKEMGRVHKGEGSWKKGIEVIEESIKDFGVNPNNLLIRDGSGISHVNLVTGNALSHFLVAIQNEQWFPSFEYSLPVSGNPDRMIGGTLRKRMKNDPAKGNIRAKTGTITSVSTLSGYANRSNGDKYVFSIIINNVKDEEKVTFIQDEIATILVNP